MAKFETTKDHVPKNHIDIDQEEPLTNNVEPVQRKRKADDPKATIENHTASDNRILKRRRVSRHGSRNSNENDVAPADVESPPAAVTQRVLGATTTLDPVFSEIEDPYAHLKSSSEPTPLQQAIPPEERGCLGAVDLPGTAVVFDRQGVTIHSQVCLGPRWGPDEADGDGHGEDSWAAVQEQVGDFFDDFFGLHSFDANGCDAASQETGYDGGLDEDTNDEGVVDICNDENGNDCSHREATLR